MRADTTTDEMERSFFRRGELGLFEPPVILPTHSVLVPFVGVLFLAVLTALVLS